MPRSIATAALTATLIVSACLAAADTPAHAARPLTTGFTDDVYFESPDLLATWVPRTAVTGAQVVLLDAYWSGVARPTPGVDPTNPNDPRYSWDSLDSVVRALTRSGLQVALMITNAPAWAEGPGRPAGATPGTWRPDPKAYGQFVAAMAKRYSGSFPDPANPGAALPRVRYWQAWAEPNLTVHLAPQWIKRGRSLVPASPAIYRGLLNAFYAAVKGVHRDNLVITAGTGPFGDPPGGERMPPAQFVRELLCLRGQRLTPERCPNPAHFDALAQHPYDVGAPTTKALNVDDVSAPDLGKLTRPLRVAVRRGTALPRVAKRLWITEFSYDSNPPNPQAVPVNVQARWLEESFYVFWRQGVDAVIWYLVRDQAPIPDYATAFESGVYLRDGTPKPSLQAFRFPFLIEPGRGATAWGRAPNAGTVQIQRQTGTGWTTLAQVTVRAGGVFERRLAVSGRGQFRAVDGADTSLVWSQP